MTRALVLLAGREDLSLVAVGTSVGETTVLSLLPDTSDNEQLLHDARNLGAVRCIRLWDDSLGTTDFLGLGYTLAAAIKKAMGDLAAPPTVILAGDRGRGAVGPTVADRLQLPHLGDVLSVKLLDDRVVARRRAQREGVVRLYAARPPMVLQIRSTAGAAIEVPQPASSDEAAGWMEALSTEAWSLADVGITASELAYRRRFRPRTVAELGNGRTPPVARPRVFASATDLLLRLQADGLVDHTGGGK